MNVRSQISMVFHLDKCIGCHTCSVACKNVWTDRKGAEYMWWNNVETKPGTGYPTKWEDQDKYQGGFETNGDGKLHIKSTSKTKIVPNIFHNPHMPSMDDYYEPWTYDYQNLFNAPEGSDQPTAEPISMIDGEKIDVQAGPNWDDDLGGSPIYAENDPNLDGSHGAAATAAQFGRTAGLLLPAAHLQSLPESLLRRVLPVGGTVQAGRRRHRPDRPEEVPCVAVVRRRLSVQEDLLQLVHRQEREVHSLLPATGNGTGSGLLPLLRRPHSLSGRAAVRRRATGRSRQAAGRRTGRRPTLD